MTDSAGALRETHAITYEERVHVTPLPDDPPHILSSMCWCQPVAERQPLGGYVFIHRRTLDSPHIERPR